MDENLNNEREFYMLEDEDGNEIEFELIGKAEINGKIYYAMIPTDAEQAEDGFCEYVILREDTDEDGDASLVTIDDDEEFENVADFFDDAFSEEIDYDAQN